ncbi:MAG: hypothetical protein IJ814_07540 [Paludibacteraceae bacterium]|nr:hypothetical protein [Paludibacteraceae bacterium]
MKKIMISLLMVAATLNAMAITYSGKVKVRLTSSDNQYCEAVVATSDALNDGLNNSYYAPFNDENKEVHLYVEFGGTRYAHFGSSAATMTNMPLLMKANSATSYTFTFSAMVGTIEIYDKEAGANIDKSQPYNFTIDAGEANTIIADRFIINYVAPAPVYDAQVTTNEYGWASFSYAGNLAPVDATAQTLYKGTISGDVLALDEVDYVKEGQGVLVKGAANTTYYFAVGNGSADFEGNDLRPTSAYSYPMENVFVLKGEAFLEYIGTTALKANKAFIQLPQSGASAPKRIRMVVNQATGVENAAVEVKAEKFIENGQVLIRRGNEVYNLQGQIVK